MGAAWALNKDQARAEEPSAGFTDRLLKLVSRKAWRSGYDMALRDLAVGDLREHLIGATKPKKRFASEEYALAFAHRCGHDRVKAYECGVCGDWHLATVRT